VYLAEQEVLGEYNSLYPGVYNLEFSEWFLIVDIERRV